MTEDEKGVFWTVANDVFQTLENDDTSPREAAHAVVDFAIAIGHLAALKEKRRTGLAPAQTEANWAMFFAEVGKKIDAEGKPREWVLPVEQGDRV